MALTNEDYLDILRHLQATIRQYDPELSEPFSEIGQIDDTPRHLVMRYISSLIGAYKQHSAGTYPRVLSLLSQYIRPIEGRQITGIRIALSPQERELYQMDEVNLSEMPSLDELLAELQGIYDLIEREAPEERTNPT